MNFQLRKQRLLAILDEHGSLEVADIAQQLHTTPITIRRDLAQLAAKGLVVRTHGGAVLPHVAKAPVSFARKATANLAQKEHICRLAASQIADGDTIFIDCGSTTFPLCQLIRHRKLRVVTNSLPVLFELADVIERAPAALARARDASVPVAACRAAVYRHTCLIKFISP